jgi:hypothetical protein
VKYILAKFIEILTLLLYHIINNKFRYATFKTSLFNFQCFKLKDITTNIKIKITSFFNEYFLNTIFSKFVILHFPFEVFRIHDDIKEAQLIFYEIMI